MIASHFNNMKITGIAGAVPKKHVDNMDYANVFGREEVEKMISFTGIKGSYMCEEEQTAGDLCYAAAKELIEKKGINPNSIGVLICVVVYHDYISPATASVLQKRLDISSDCIVYDINLGCSGFIYGLHTLCSLLQCTNADRGLLLVGDTTSKSASPYDKSRMLFGDAASAILVEKSQDSCETMNFGLKSDGNRYKSLIIPAGGYRKRNTSLERVLQSDGNKRSEYDLYMNGADVFEFTLSDVPALFREFFEHYQLTPFDIDYLLLHQANLFVIKHIAKKLKISMEKVPISLDRYGNSSGATIPITICDAFSGINDKEKIHAVASGFGVGLSWGVVSMEIAIDGICPIIHTDEYYLDGYNE